VAFAPGTRLGPYEVTALLGEGGMGQVYRARDTKLNRDVALKVLPESFANDPDRLARFQREAQVLASLNHPNIAHIHGFEESGGVRALVMELVEGEDLAQRLTRGAIPIDEALPIAKQIAEALEAAHEQGIIHRDLKPANIKVTPDGRVKVLDFGLAKAMETVGAMSASLSMSPTITSPAMTQAGMILGTAAYMSPEQARGKSIDKRVDIWAFGCVLFEMLSGRRPFDGETISDVLAKVIEREPDWSALPATTADRLRELLRRCLTKDPKARLRDIGDVRIEFTEGPGEPMLRPPGPSIVPSIARRPFWRRGLPTLAACILVGTLSAVAGWILKTPSPGPPARFSMALGEGVNFTSLGYQMVAISPDGTQIVYVANNRLYLRSLTDFEPHVIPGSDLGSTVSNPVFSEDGSAVVFWSALDRTLKKLAIGGGPAVTLCAAASPFGMSWTGDAILFAQPDQGILRVAAKGGKPEILISIKDGVAYGPQMLPDGQTVLFTEAATTMAGEGTQRWDKARVVAQSLKTGERKTVIESGSDGRYLPTEHLVYGINGILFAAPFDLKHLSTIGEAVPVVEGIRRSTATPAGTAAAQFAVSKSGSLVYIPGPAASLGALEDIALIARKGTVDRLNLQAAAYEYPRVSPNGKAIVFGISDGKEASIWVYDLAGKSSKRQLTVGGHNRFPIWTADGQRVAFQSDREGDAAIFWQRADGTGNAERITKPEQGSAHIPDSWWPTGDQFLFESVSGSDYSLWTYSISQKKATRFGDVHSRYPANATFSPDGRWVAYSSTEVGNASIYVQPYPATNTKYPISKTGTTQYHHPVWSPDGTELFYIPGPNAFEVVRVLTTSPTFTFSNPTPVRRAFNESGPGTARTYDLLSNQRIVGVVDATSTESISVAEPQVRIVMNWFEELKQRVPTK
jgi:eukaryotic-like serine/threonine-protein kinase